MAQVDVTYSIENEQQFWDELAEIVSTPCDSHGSIDNALRTWLYLVASCRDRFLASEDDVANCSQRLIDSHIFAHHSDYVRKQIIYSLLQEEEWGQLHVIANFLLLDGRSDEASFRLMLDEGCFVRLLELLQGCRDHDRRLHRLLLELMYEMSRIERLRPEDLTHVDDGFVMYLFRLIEALSDDMDDPYHYPIIRVLLVLNEQYMVASTTAAVDPSAVTPPLTNRVIKILSIHGPVFRTFGENIILLLNRETETSLQLLILKLLYLLFTTEATYEYFYTNDLRVLLDVIIRNLLDLPNELMSLRHTYLRVLYPLLAHTQLSQAPHYKREEILKLLRILGDSGNTHFAPADETTLRLVDRVSKVHWLADEHPLSGEAEVARKLLGISLSDEHRASTISMVDVAAVTEKPGVQTPSRRDIAEAGGGEREVGKEVSTANGEAEEVIIIQERQKHQQHKQARDERPKRVLPEVPRHRHGIPMTPIMVPPAGGNGMPATTGMIRVNGEAVRVNSEVMQKRTPPKLPPPRRRTKLKAVTSSAESLVAGETLHSVAGSTPVS